MDPREKARTKFHFHRPGVDAFNTAKIGQGKNQKPQVTIVFYLYFTRLDLKGLSHEMDLAFDDRLVSTGPKKGTGRVFKFFRCSNAFITEKVYFSRLMRVYLGLMITGSRVYLVHVSSRPFKHIICCSFVDPEPRESALIYCRLDPDPGRQKRLAKKEKK
jgi:hypothetical protein